MAMLYNRELELRLIGFQFGTRRFTAESQGCVVNQHYQQEAGGVLFNQ